MTGQMSPIEIVDAPARRLLSMPHRGPYAGIGATFGRLADQLAETGLRGQAGELVAIYLDDPEATPPGALRAHAGVTVSEKAPCPPGLHEVRAPGGRCAKLRVTGPHVLLADAHRRILDAVGAAEDMEPADAPVFEVYRNTPRNAAPEDLVTDILVPLA